MNEETKVGLLKIAFDLTALTISKAGLTASENNQAGIEAIFKQCIKSVTEQYQELD